MAYWLIDAWQSFVIRHLTLHIPPSNKKRQPTVASKNFYSQ